MPAELRNFAINADDFDRAQGFYEQVFGWTFRAWGPPGYAISRSMSGRVTGSLKQRDDLVEGVRANTFEQTFAVEDLAATLREAEAAGGRVAVQPYEIETVGKLAYLEDTEGNLVGAMEYVGPVQPAEPPADGVLRHFAINAGDVGRAMAFYEATFGWQFTPSGPPNFYQTRSVGPGLIGALQERRELVPCVRANHFEMTIGVADLAATIRRIGAAGGRIVMAPYEISGGGELIFFEDTEGNIAGAMQYAPIAVWNT